MIFRAASASAGLVLAAPMLKWRERTSEPIACESRIATWWRRGKAPPSTNGFPEVSSVLARVRPSTACIFGIKESAAQKFSNGKPRPSEVTETDATFLGSGFAYGDGTFVATCAHLFDGHGSDGSLLLRFGDGSWRRARVWAMSSSSDIAVLRIDEENSLKQGPGLPFKTPPELPLQGESVLVIGAPQYGRESVCLVGLVSQPCQTLRGGLAEEAGVKFVQLAVPTLPGMSGSPVLNQQGEVVAMLAKKFEEHGLALPAAHVAKVVCGLERYRCWRPPVLGLELDPGGSLVEPTVNVRRVVVNGPSQSVGICAGDRLLAIGMEPVRSVLEVRSVLSSLGGEGAAAGNTGSIKVRLLLEREGRTFEAIVLAPPS